MAKRLEKELERLFAALPPSIESITLREGDNKAWTVVFLGPADTPYAGGRFSANVDIPPEYPFRAPTKVVFTTQIYHPNVDKDGNVCLQAFTENWSPQKKMAEFLEDVRQMIFVNAHLETPLRATIAEEYKNNKAKFDATAAKWTKKYAM